MLDLDDELVRFGHWLDDRIDAEQVGTPVAIDRRSVQRRPPLRLPILAAAAAIVIVAAMLVTGAHRATDDGPGTQAPSSAATATSVVGPAGTTTVNVSPVSTSLTDGSTTPTPAPEGSPGQLHLVPADVASVDISTRAEPIDMRGGLAVLVGRPSGRGFTDVWWIGAGRPPQPEEVSELQPEGRRAFGSSARINERGTSVRFIAAPYTETISPPCPPDAPLCPATPDLRQLIDSTVIGDTGQVSWTLPTGMVEIARTTGAVLGSPIASAKDGSYEVNIYTTATIDDLLAIVPADIERTSVRGHEAWFAMVSPMVRLRGGQRVMALTWEERPGTIVAVTGRLSHEGLAAIAEGLRVATEEEWASLVVAAEAHAPNPATYTVVTEDTWQVIADKLGVRLQDLLGANPDVDPEKFLVVGQRLRVPTSP